MAVSVRRLPVRPACPAEDSAREASEEVRQIEAARLDELTRTLMRVLATKHYVVSAASGVVARNPETKQLLLDDGPVIQAVAGLLRISERRSKLLGLDAAGEVPR